MKQSARAIAERAADVRLLLLDVDGVLTDGRLYFGPRGEALKVFHVRDGHGIRALRHAGIEVAIVSGRRSPMVSARARELGIRHVHQGIKDKLTAVAQLLSSLDLSLGACACVGDDEPDVPLMRAARLAIAVADAHPLALRAAHLVTRLPGGCGAVREVCELLLARRAPRRSAR